MTLTLDDLPTAIMGVAGILLLLLALKAADFAAIKLINALMGVGLMLAAIWWFIRLH